MKLSIALLAAAAFGSALAAPQVDAHLWTTSSPTSSTRTTLLPSTSSWCRGWKAPETWPVPIPTAATKKVTFANANDAANDANDKKTRVNNDIDTCNKVHTNRDLTIVAIGTLNTDLDDLLTDVGILVADLLTDLGNVVEDVLVIVAALLVDIAVILVNLGTVLTTITTSTSIGLVPALVILLEVLVAEVLALLGPIINNVLILVAELVDLDVPLVVSQITTTVNTITTAVCDIDVILQPVVGGILTVFT